MTRSKKIVLAIALLSLAGTMTNYIYVSPLLTLLLPLSIFVFNKQSLERPIVWLYAFALLFVVSAFIYDPTSLVTFGFYRRDGNFIISYAPLLVLPLLSLSVNLKKYLRYFYLLTLLVYVPLFVLYLLRISQGTSINEMVFGGLFVAQNALGGFLAVVAALSFAFARNRKTKYDWLLFILIFLILISTYSRGSILGFVLGLGAWYLTINNYYKTLILYLTVPILCTVGALMIGYPRYKQIISRSNYAEPDVGEEGGIGSKGANILIRVFYTFPRAYYSFKKSPFIGIGVGAYDDRPYQFKEIIPLVQYNAQPNKQHTSSHAHHSYLHILAEQGIFGLGLFLTFWVSLFWYIVRLEEKSFWRDFLLISFFTITIESFTEHRITTPSNMLPFTIPLGLLMAQKEKVKTFLIERISAK